MRFVTHDLDGKARGAIALVIGGERVLIGKVEVRWDVEVRWLGFEGGVGAVGQGRSEGIVQV